MDSPDQGQTEKRKNEAGVGALLKASRLRVGGDLHQIADILRVRYVYMEAIEDGRFDALPGPTYATGFIRAYAEHLGLDSQEVVRRLKNETAATPDTSNLVFPEPIPEAGVPGGAVIFVGIVVAAVAYGAWYINSNKNGYLVELISPLPDRLARLVEGDNKGAAKPAATAPEVKEAAKEEAKEPAKQESPPAAKPEAAPETKQETKPEAKAEAKPEAQPAPALAKPETKPEATADAKPEPASSPAPARQPEAAPVQAAASAEPRQTPESRETPVATQRPAPAASAEPLVAPTNVPVDMIPPPKPAAAPLVATPAATAAATPASSPATTPSPAEPPAGPAQPSAQPAAATETPAATTEASTAPASTPAASTSAAPAPASTPEPASTPAASTSAAPAPASTPEPATASASANAPAAPASGEAKTRIVVRAKQNSWIQVRDDTANELLVTRLLRSGDSYPVPDRPGLRLSTGNAGALEILVDGQAVPAIGEDGAVRRNVLLDAEKLKAGQAVGE